MRHVLICMTMMILMIFSCSAYDKDAVFRDLKMNDVEGKALFEMESPFIDGELSLNFIEDCGYVESYSIYRQTECEKEVREPVYSDPYQECSDGKNASGKECFETRDIIRYDSYIDYVPCEEKIDKIPIGLYDYRVDMDIVADYCDDGTFGYKIDWIPELTKDASSITQEKWAWMNASFPYCRDIEIMNSTSNMSNFTIYIGLDNMTNMLADGNGTMFVNGECNETASIIPYEFEFINTTEGHVWAMLPEIQTDNQTISMYYGGDNVDMSDEENAWNDDYIAVWHMDEYDESTSNSLDMSNTIGGATLPTIVDGRIHNSYSFDGGDHLNDSSLANFGSSMNTGATMSVWLKYTDNTAYRQFFAYADNSDGEVNYQIALNTGTPGEFRYLIDGPGTAVGCTGTYAGGLNDGTWHHVSSFVKKEDAVRCSMSSYVDGTYDMVLMSADDNTAMNDFADSPGFGAMHDRRGVDNYINHITGSMDEIRLYAGNYTEPWARYEYDNIVSQGSYVSVGEEELAPPGQPYTSLKASKADIQESDVASTTPVNISKFEINILEDTDLIISGGMNIEKTTGGGTNAVYITIYNTTGGIVTDELLRTVSTVGDVGVVAMKPVSTYLAAGNHNISFAFRRSGAGNIHIDNADIILMQLKTNDSDDVRGSIETGIYSYSNAAETIAATINITTSPSRSVIMCMRETVSKTTSGESDLFVRANETENDIISPFWGRTLSSSTDIGNMMGMTRFNLTTANMSIDILARQDDVGDTVTSNYSMFTIDMMDNRSIEITSFAATRDDTNISSTVSFTAGTNEIMSIMHTTQSGDGILIMPQFTIRSATGIQTPQVFVNTSTVSEVDCLSIKDRYLPSSTDIGNIPIGFLCNATVPETTYNITAYITVAASETVVLYDESMVGFDTQSFILTSLNTAPFVAQPCADQDVLHNVDMSCAFNFTDPQSDALVYATNDSRVTIVGTSVTDNPSLSDYNSPDGWDITINATDGELWAEFEFNYVIDDTRPNLGGVFTTSPAEGVDATVNVSFVDQEDDIMNFSIEWLVEGVSISKINVSNLSNGTLVYTLAESNFVLNDLVQASLYSDDGVLNRTLILNATVAETLEGDELISTELSVLNDRIDLFMIFAITILLLSAGYLLRTPILVFAGWVGVLLFSFMLVEISIPFSILLGLVSGVFMMLTYIDNRTSD